MLRMSEFELKFHVPRERADAVAAAVQRGSFDEKRLQARYYDTADGALAKAKVVLRLRNEDGQWVQAAKAPGRTAFERLEHEVPVGTGEVPPLDLSLHDREPVGARLREALGDGSPV